MTAPRRRVRATARAALVALSLSALLGACTDPKPDPAQARLNRVEKRLRATFSDAQARCIVERSDPEVIQALDRTVDLAPDSKVLAAYSDAVAACVTDPETTTTRVPSTSTTQAKPTP